MLIKVKKGIGIILVFSLILLAGLFVFNRQQGVFLGDSIEVPTITPIPQPKVSGEAKSIDGKKTVIMQTLQQSDGMAFYTFLISDEEREYSIFTSNSKKNAFSVPSNSWSPDGTYIFLIDGTTLPQQILVFKSSGEPFSDGQKYLNVTELFGERITQYRLDTATGWDSRGLLHIRTKNQDGSKGSSFWFDVDSRSFIQLAAR